MMRDWLGQQFHINVATVAVMKAPQGLGKLAK
jgi:hypothetical protein